MQKSMFQTSKYSCFVLLLVSFPLVCCEDIETDVNDETTSDEFCERKEDGDVQCSITTDISLTRLEPGENGSMRRIEINKDKTLELRTVSSKPVIFEIENFLTPEECEYFIALAKTEGLKHSETILNPNNNRFSLLDINNDRKLSVHELRLTIQDSFDIYLDDEDVKTLMKDMGLDKNNDLYITPDEMSASNPQAMSDYLEQIVQERPELRSRHSRQVWLYPDQSTDTVFEQLQRRVSAVTELPMPLLKRSDFQVVNYGVNGHYNAHYDSSIKNKDEPAVCCTRERTQACRICRFMTILFYLNDVQDGGETAFPLANDDNKTVGIDSTMDLREKMDLFRNCGDANLVVEPARGKAVIWYNHEIDPDTHWMGKMDRFTLHGGCPVFEGEKWIANFWIKTTDDKEHDLKMMSYL